MAERGGRNHWQLATLEVRKQSEIKAHAQLSFSDLFSLGPQPEDLGLYSVCFLSYSFLESQPQTHGRVCFHVDSELSRFNNED